MSRYARYPFVALCVAVLWLAVAQHAQAAGLAIDASVKTHQALPAASITSGAISTTAANDLLVAFITSDGPRTAGGQSFSSVTGGGLTWRLRQRANAQAGTAEVWEAVAPAVLSGVTITATRSSGSYIGSIVECPQPDLHPAVELHQPQQSARVVSRLGRRVRPDRPGTADRPERRARRNVHPSRNRRPRARAHGEQLEQRRDRHAAADQRTFGEHHLADESREHAAERQPHGARRRGQRVRNGATASDSHGDGAGDGLLGAVPTRWAAVGESCDCRSVHVQLDGR